MSTVVEYKKRAQAASLADEVLHLKVYTRRNLDQIAPLRHLPEDWRFAMWVVAHVLPFRVNQHVVNELIDWSNIPDDPIFQLTFPQPEMLSRAHFNRMADLLRANASRDVLRKAAIEIYSDLNPHPAGQREMNVPQIDDEPLPGVQHKYRETVLFFPSQGQTCHSYCTFCFRWPQFVGYKGLRFSANKAAGLHQYLKEHVEVTDLLVTGGDPLVMKTKLLAAHIKPLLAPEFKHLRNIRIGTKALTYWPYRFLGDDADELLRLFERLVRNGKHVALMAHITHWRELDPPVAREAIRRVRDTGAVIRTQAPLIAHINDDNRVWARMWRTQVRLGMVPYYMFVERDTGPRHYFEVPLAQGWHIYRRAIRRLSGLARTARGPTMSAGPGKVEVQGVSVIRGERVFILRFLQGRNPDWVHHPFFAEFDPQASWLDQLKPAFNEKEFFYEPEYRSMCLKFATPQD
ncbi:MAG: KamA family radical SAM protein [Candidatus Neomarinimicrobiota bacterium]